MANMVYKPWLDPWTEQDNSALANLMSLLNENYIIVFHISDTKVILTGRTF